MKNRRDVMYVKMKNNTSLKIQNTPPLYGYIKKIFKVIVDVQNVSTINEKSYLYVQ